MKLRCEVFPKKEYHQWRDFLGLSFLKGKLFLVDSNSNRAGEAALEVLVDPVFEESSLGSFDHMNEWDWEWLAEILYRPGVTDNQGHTAAEGFGLLGVECDVASGDLILFRGGSRDEVLDVLKSGFANELIQSIHLSGRDELSGGRFDNITLPRVKLEGAHHVETINLEVEDEKLETLSRDRCLALSLAELHTIRNHYRADKTLAKRKELGLPAGPTDVELEVYAQTWSEHCKHKIFSASINYDEEGDLMGAKAYGKGRVDGLFKETIKATTETVKKERKLDWLVSVFSDNAGIVRWDDNIDLCLKVETHNSPSALDPYGGALTGILGVNRDILGCGMGAKPIANTDVFCFSRPDWPDHKDRGYMPKGVTHPERILKGVHKGVEDGGNKSGIPTINGAFAFDHCFAGKPLVFVGTLGALPRTSAGKPTSEKRARPGDLIVVCGGAVGRDGIHGATFSSLELDESAPATAVQIGDPLTQKRTGDFILEARERDLYNCITDNGAGGISSSVGEMAELTGGAELHLDRHPMKYPGLLPYEIMISESQERMTLAVAAEKYDELKKLADSRGVMMCELGTFKSDGKLDVFYKGDQVAHFDMEFLHKGLPAMNLTAKWSGPKEREDWRPAHARNDLGLSGNLETKLLTVLRHPNVASKESWVRQYDHEVQGATVMKPFHLSRQGDSSGPNDAGGVWLAPHGGEEKNVVSVACGLSYYSSHVDTRIMAIMAVDEAVRNLIATGVDPERIAGLDNFCWPDPLEGPKNPQAHHKLGQLVRCAFGLKEICLSYGIPLISGKDSMKNDFKGVDVAGRPCHISVEPTLLVTAMGMARKNAMATPAFRQEGDVIFLIRPVFATMGISLFSCGKPETVPDWGDSELESCFETYKQLHELITRGKLSSIHDISEGGALAALVECSLAEKLGAELEWMGAGDDELFGEAPGGFIVSTSADMAFELEELLESRATRLGVVRSNQNISLDTGAERYSWSLADLEKAWRQEVGR